VGVVRLPAPFVSELEPLLVTAPSTRCGTTLLQRLICSAPNAMLFGETVGSDVEIGLNFGYARATMYEMNRAVIETKLEAVYAGDVNKWLLDLAPETQPYIAALRAYYEQPLLACRDSAARRGRNVWGLKYPRWPAPVIDLLRAALPRARWIYIHRNLLDCVKSAKARGELRRPGDVAAYAQEWSANRAHVLSLPASERVLVLDYDDLLRDAEAFLRRVEQHSGAAPIDRGVLAHKVNDSSGYLAPAELTDEERAVVERFA
jgi:Sulfotransferase family